MHALLYRMTWLLFTTGLTAGSWSWILTNVKHWPSITNVIHANPLTNNLYFLESCEISWLVCGLCTSWVGITIVCLLLLKLPSLWIAWGVQCLTAVVRPSMWRTRQSCMYEINCIAIWAITQIINSIWNSWIAEIYLYNGTFHWDISAICYICLPLLIWNMWYLYIHRPPALITLF